MLLMQFDPDGDIWTERLDTNQRLEFEKGPEQLHVHLIAGWSWGSGDRFPSPAISK